MALLNEGATKLLGMSNKFERKGKMLFDQIGSTYSEAINKAHAMYPNVSTKMITAMIEMESSGNKNAISSKGAEGLLQLMPSTARQLGVTNPFNASENIQGGAKYMSQLLERYHGNKELALAAYNHGMGNVDKHGLNHLPEETQQYIQKYHSISGE